jgi:hypothetical protein
MSDEIVVAVHIYDSDVKNKSFKMKRTSLSLHYKKRVIGLGSYFSPQPIPPRSPLTSGLAE